MSLVLDEHRQYLSDSPRVAAFEKAIAQVVKAGDVVVDLAAGTGILGLLACRAGAARVYAIESDSIVSIARRVAAVNGFADRIRFVHEVSTRAVLPERADVIVTDQAGRFGVDAGLVELLDDARRRFLKPGGRMVPRSLTLWVAPVELPDLWQQVQFWKSPIAGFSFEPAHPLAASTGYPRHVGASDLIGPAGTVAAIDLMRPAPALVSGSIEVRITRAGTMHGVAGWFSADLADGVDLTNAPGAPARINRRNVFFPCAQPVVVEPGDCVRAMIRVRPADVIVSWTIEAQTRSGFHRSSASTFTGMLIDPDELRRLDPSAVLVLTPAGEARRTILDLCGNGMSLGEIERELFARHRALFPTPAEAAAFVAEVAIRYMN